MRTIIAFFGVLLLKRITDFTDIFGALAYTIFALALISFCAYLDYYQIIKKK